MFLKTLRTVLLASALIIVANQASAQLFTRTFTAASACPTGDNNLMAITGASLSPVSRSASGVTCNNTANVFNSSFTATGTSIDLTKYIEFTLTADVGYNLTLTSIDYGRQRSSTGPQNSRVAHNFSGNFTTDFLDDASVPTSISALTWNFTDFTVTSGNSVTFRIYGWNNTGGTLRIDDLNIYGSVAAASGNPASVSVSPSTGSEAAQTSITITVTTGSNVAANSTVDYTISGTGITSSDFVGSPSLTGTIQVLAGSNTGTASVQIFDDPNSEGDETANVSISNPTGSITSASGSSSFLIQDNDIKYYWNGGNIAANPANGGTGTWTTANSWRQPDATGSQASWVDGKDAVLAGISGVLSIANGTTVAPSTLAIKTSGYTITSDGTTTTVLTGPVTLDPSVNLNLNDGTATGNRTLSVDNISGGAGSTVSIIGAQTGSNNSRVNLASTGASISVPVIINSTGGASALAGVVATAGNTSISGSITNNSANCKTMLGATSGNSLNVSGQISGSQSVQFSAGTSGGAGTITLTNTNNYTGNSIFSLAASGTVKLGVANALPASGLIIGGSSGSGGNLDLNGFDESIGSLSTGSGAVGSITNSATGAGTNTLTVTQSTNTSFDLAINDGATRKIALTKAGGGTLKLTLSNTFTGGLNLNGGFIELGNGNIIANSCNLVFNGGGLSSGTTTGYNETVGTATLSNNSNISLGSGVHQLKFANSSAASWTAGKTLVINGWVGTPGNSGTSGQILFGNDNTGLTAAQLAQITFTGYSPGAIILGTGEIVPASATLIVDQTGFVSNFGNVNLGNSSAEQSFTVTGSSLASTVTITPPVGFQVSLTSGSGFGTSPIVLLTTGGNLALTTVYVQFTPVAAGVASGNISVVSGAVTQNVAVSGNGVVSAFYSRGNGYAATDAIWSYSPSGTAQTIASLGGFSSGIDVIVQTGNTVKTIASQEITAKNLTIQSGASLQGDPASTGNFTPFYINVFGNVLADGQFGLPGSPDSLGLNMEGANATISGNGSVDIQRLRKSDNTNSVTNLNINRNVNLYWSGTAMYNNVSSTFNVIVGNGATLACLAGGDISIDGTDGLGSGNRWGTITVNGTLTADTIYARTDNSTANPTGIAVAASGIVNAQLIHLRLTGNTFNFTVAAGGLVNIFKALELVAGNFTPAGTVVLKSTSASNNAYLDNFSAGFTGSYTGDITAERYVPVAGSNQHYLASPVSNVPFSALGATGTDGAHVIPTANCDETTAANNSPSGKVFQYTEGYAAPGACPLANWMVRSSGNLDVARGYSTYLNGNSVLSLTGAPQTGNQTVSTNNSSNPTVTTLQGHPIESGWNLVGNPYPSAIDLTTSRVGNGFQNQVQIWVTSGPFSGSYQSATINGTPGAIVVAPFQGFMVRQTSAGSGSYPFFQAERSKATNTNFYFTASNQTLSLEVEHNGVKDITRVEFNDNGTTSFDDEFDANKLQGATGRPTLCTRVSGSQRYSINVLPALTQVTAVPMDLCPGVSGTFTFTPNGISSFDPTAYIMLEDKKTGVMHNLRNGVYTFTATAGEAEDRFVLHFTPGLEIAGNDAGCLNNDGSIEIDNPAMADWNYTLTSAGNIISSGVVTSTTQINALSSGVYTLTFTDAANYTVIKNVMINAAALPQASFNASALVIEEGTAVDFTATPETNSTFSWNFGDGNTAINENATHIYQAPGSYNVELTVQNSVGCAANSSKVVTVTAGVNGIAEALNNKARIWANGNDLFIDLKTANANLQVYNLLGELVYTANVNGYFTHSFSNVSPQCFIVKLNTADQVVTRKVVLGAK